MKKLFLGIAFVVLAIIVGISQKTSAQEWQGLGSIATIQNGSCNFSGFIPAYKKLDITSCSFVDCGDNGQVACGGGFNCKDGLTNLGGVCRPYPNTSYCINYYNDGYSSDVMMQGASHEYIINKINLSNGSTIILSGTDLVRYSGDIAGSEFKNHIQGLRPSIGLINKFANPKYSISTFMSLGMMGGYVNHDGIYTTGSTGDIYIQSVEYSGYMTDGTMTGVLIGDMMHQELYIKQYTGLATFTTTCYTSSNNRTIGGRYYFDNNSSKSFDTGDIGLSGKNMYLYQYNPNALVPISPLQLVQTVITDSFGKYIFTGLSSTGKYQVRFDIMSGFDFTNIYIAELGRIITSNEVLGYYNSAYGIMQPEAGNFDNIDAGIIISNTGVNCVVPDIIPAYKQWNSSTCALESCGKEGQKACNDIGFTCDVGLQNIGGTCRPYSNTNYCVNYHNSNYTEGAPLPGLSSLVITKINLSNGSSVILSGADYNIYTGSIYVIHNPTRAVINMTGLLYKYTKNTYQQSLFPMSYSSDPTTVGGENSGPTSRNGIYTTGSTGDIYIQSVEYTGGIRSMYSETGDITLQSGTLDFTTTCYTDNTNTGVNCVVPDIIPAYQTWNTGSCSLIACGDNGQVSCNTNTGFDCKMGLQNIGGTCKPYPNINYCVNYVYGSISNNPPQFTSYSTAITKINFSNGQSATLSGNDIIYFTGISQGDFQLNTGLINKFANTSYNIYKYLTNGAHALTNYPSISSNAIYTTGLNTDIFITSVEYSGYASGWYNGQLPNQSYTGITSFITNCYTGIINPTNNVGGAGGGGYTPQPLAVNHNIIPAGTGIVNTLYGNVQTTTTNSGTTIKLLDLRNYINRSEPSTNEFPNIEVIKNKGILEIVKVGADIDLAYELAIETLNLVK